MKRDLLLAIETDMDREEEEEEDVLIVDDDEKTTSNKRSHSERIEGEA